MQLNTDKINIDINKETVVYDDGDYTCNYIVTAEYEGVSVEATGTENDRENTILRAIDKLHFKVKLLHIYKNIPEENITIRETEEDEED